MIGIGMILMAVLLYFIMGNITLCVVSILRGVLIPDDMVLSLLLLWPMWFIRGLWRLLSKGVTQTSSIVVGIFKAFIDG